MAFRVLIACGACLAWTAHGFSGEDIMGTKVWFDKYLFNMTLRTVNVNGQKVFSPSEEKARENQIPWPIERWPTLCFLGLGKWSIDFLSAVLLVFPELQIALVEVAETPWIETHLNVVGDGGKKRIRFNKIEDFAETAGSARQKCDALSWSPDSQDFSFHRFRELFYSTPSIVALFNMNGCTDETEHQRSSLAQNFYCEYLLMIYDATVCAKVTETSMVRTPNGTDIFFPGVHAECTSTLCMCHASPDAFMDFHFEHMCRKGNPPRFVGQWRQDEFLVTNLFRDIVWRKNGIYVDVGTSHPYFLSNTAFLDDCMGWRGICVEPNPRWTPIIRALRTCKLVPRCAWTNQTSLRFASGGELAARVDPSTPDGEDNWEAQCDTLHNLLLHAGPGLYNESDDGDWEMGDKPVIDLLSVDAEGAEIEILKDFPFSLWAVQVIVVEVGRQTSMAMDSILLPWGFVKVAILGKDVVYLSPKAAKALPEDGIKLPKQILWNEPGTDRDYIDYFRFQRFFGVDGDLDDEVGDQRIKNDTELQRQGERTEARWDRMFATIIEDASESGFGGLVSDAEKKVLGDPTVTSHLRDPEVRPVLNLLTHLKLEEFKSAAKSSSRVLASLSILHKAGVLKHPVVEEVLREANL